MSANCPPTRLLIYLQVFESLAPLWLTLRVSTNPEMANAE